MCTVEKKELVQASMQVVVERHDACGAALELRRALAVLSASTNVVDSGGVDDDTPVQAFNRWKSGFTACTGCPVCRMKGVPMSFSTAKLYVGGGCLRCCAVPYSLCHSVILSPSFCHSVFVCVCVCAGEQHPSLWRPPEASGRGVGQRRCPDVRVGVAGVEGD